MRTSALGLGLAVDASRLTSSPSRRSTVAQAGWARHPILPSAPAETLTASVAGRSTSTVQRGVVDDGLSPVQTGENVAEMLSGCDETAAVGASGAMAAFLTNDAAVIRARGRLLDHRGGRHLCVRACAVGRAVLRRRSSPSRRVL